MGQGTRGKEIRQRRSRRRKRKKQETRVVRAAIRRGRTHEDRVRLAQEAREKLLAGT